jgi:hypothetical protein
MAIEFRCTQCGKLLRTGDETAGKHAKCPQCGAVMTIPAAPGGAAPPPPAPPGGGTPFSGAGAQPAGTAGSANPYQSPAPFAPVGASQVSGAITPTTLDFGDIFNRTWSIFKEQWGMCLAGGITAMVAMFLGVMVLFYGPFLVAAATRSVLLMIGAVLFGVPAAFLFITWMIVGVVKFFLAIARGKEAAVGELFSGGSQFVPVVLAGILFSLIGMGVFLVCLMPGILVMVVVPVIGKPLYFLGMVVAYVAMFIINLMFSQVYLLIIDREMPVIESFKLSKDLMNGNKLTLFLIWLVAGLGGSLISVITCGLGYFAVVPFLALMAPVIYLAITGQPTADQVK